MWHNFLASALQRSPERWYPRIGCLQTSSFTCEAWSFAKKWLSISRLWCSESLKPIMGKVIVIEEGSVIFVLVWLISINKDSIPPYLHETVLEATLMKNQWTESLSAYNSLFRFSSRKYKFSLLYFCWTNSLSNLTV